MLTFAATSAKGDLRQPLSARQLLPPNRSPAMLHRLHTLAAVGSLALCCAPTATAQTSTASAEVESGIRLQDTLHDLIVVHKDLGYDNLWTAFGVTDRRPDGKIYDIYSSISNFEFQAKGESVSSSEGVNYNREHSVPQSWFGKASPMKADLFHVYPVDGHTNSLRNDHPYGEVGKVEKSTAGGFSRYGTPTKECGAPCPVFEPNDVYKGDLARTYFYMMTCYKDRSAGWTGEVFGKTSAPDTHTGYDNYPGMARWALRMFIRWSAEDPVSQKERDRNEAIYQLQGNRNPFIDSPGLERFIWSEYVE